MLTKENHPDAISLASSGWQLKPHVMPEITAVLHQCLDDAAKDPMKHYGKIDSFDKKSEIDLVTIADRESEACIKRIVSAAFPTHQILAEETGEDYSGKSDSHRWIIDPVDGTTNYAHSFPRSFSQHCGGAQGPDYCRGESNPLF